MTKHISIVLLCLLASLSTISQARQQPSSPDPAPAHDRQFWRNIVKNNYRVPPGPPVLPLINELSTYFASPDPELRDDLAYSLIDAWILRQKLLSAPELISLLDQWQANLRTGIGEAGTDTVLLRSFSALNLATLAERDLRTPFLGADRYRTLLDNALSYLRDERDLRGFDPHKGWIHSTAHTADLLTALAANPLFAAQKSTAPENQLRLFQAISDRLSSAHLIFAYGEQDRLAATIATLVSRTDFDPATFHSWLSTLDETDRNVWKQSPPDDNLLKTYQNNNYLLQSLAARLYAAQPKSAAIIATLDEVTAILRKR